MTDLLRSTQSELGLPMMQKSCRKRTRPQGAGRRIIGGRRRNPVAIINSDVTIKTDFAITIARTGYVGLTKISLHHRAYYRSSLKENQHLFPVIEPPVEQ